MAPFWVVQPFANQFVFVCLFCFCFFLGPHLRHMEVPRLGVLLKLHLPATATATGDPSLVSTYTTAHSITGTLAHWAQPGIESESSWILVRFLNHWATTGTPTCSVGLCFFLITWAGTRRSVTFTFLLNLGKCQALIPLLLYNNSNHSVRIHSFILSFFSFLPFLGLLPWHMEVPRLGV